MQKKCDPRESTDGPDDREVIAEHDIASPEYEDMLAALDAAETPCDVGAEPSPALRETSRTLLGALREAGKRPMLGERAASITHDLLDIVEEAARSGELDVNDALRLLPPVHRVREHDDKIELQRNGTDNLINISWVIGASGNISAQVVPATKVNDAVEVIEADDDSQANDAGEHDPQAQQSGMVFDLLPVQQRAGAERGDA